jgi:hypothetical protein
MCDNENNTAITSYGFQTKLKDAVHDEAFESVAPPHVTIARVQHSTQSTADESGDVPVSSDEDEAVAGRYGYGREKLSLDEVQIHGRNPTLPVLAKDKPVPPCDLSRWQPPVAGYPKGYPSAAGPLWTGEKK